MNGLRIVRFAVYRLRQAQLRRETSRALNYLHLRLRWYPNHDILQAQRRICVMQSKLSLPHATESVYCHGFQAFRLPLRVEAFP